MSTDKAALTKMFNAALIPMFKTNAAFYAPLISRLELIWHVDIPSAWGHTNGKKLNLNPDKFPGLKPACRTTLIYHEVMHVARLHMLRRGNRKPRLWNFACDIYINLQIQKLGYDFSDFMSRKDTLDPQYEGMAEEEIYTDLVEKGFDPPEDFEPDMGCPEDPDDTDPLTPDQIHDLIAAVQQAHIASGISGGKSEMHDEIFDALLNPVVPWEQHLRQFFSSLSRKKLSWKKRNRRFPNQFLPAMVPSRKGLDHLSYYIDVSGSITDEDVTRVHSELTHLWRRFKPNKMTVVQFDTEIAAEDTFTANHPYKKLNIKARGGTDMACVAEHIDKTRPTAAIIFSDNECDPMPEPESPIPVFWLINGTWGFVPTFGKIIPYG